MHTSGGSHLETEQSLCPFKMLTGLPCPGCGITKSMVYLYEGNLLKSLQFHVLGPFVIAFSIALIGLLLTEIATGKEYFNQYFYNRKLAWALGFLLIAYHLSRLVYFIATTSSSDIVKQSIWR